MNLWTFLLLTFFNACTSATNGGWYRLRHTGNVTAEELFNYKFSRDDDAAALKEFGIAVANLDAKSTVKTSEYPCKVKEYGTGWGAHMLCSNKEQYHHRKNSPCRFISIGISYDFSFDTMLHEEHGCVGLASDPSIKHPTQLTAGSLFIDGAINTLPVENRNKTWTYYSIPSLVAWFGGHIDVLKMDCEGCEYAIAPDLMKEAPGMFLGIQQFNIEMHFPVRFTPTDEHVYNLGRLYRLLQLSDMTLRHVDYGGCGRPYECSDLLNTYLQCKPGCRSYLFAKSK